MGLEAYLFTVTFERELTQTELEHLFAETGLTKAGSGGESIEEFRSLYYEKESENGITEIHCRFPPGKAAISRFQVRFSIASPVQIIDQTFEIFAELNERVKIKVWDSEIFNEASLKNRNVDLSDQERKTLYQDCYIPLEKTVFIENRHNVYKRILILDRTRKKGIVRSGEETIRFLEENHLGF